MKAKCRANLNITKQLWGCANFDGEACYLEAQQIVIDECPNLFFASPMEYFFVSAGLEGFAPYAANANDFNNVTLK